MAISEVLKKLNGYREFIGPRALYLRFRNWIQDQIPLPGDLRVHHGGPSGWGGGAITLQKLQRYFPDHRFRYNIIYSELRRMSLDEWRRAKKRGVKLVYYADATFLPAYYPNDWKERNAKLKEYYDLADYVFFQSRFSKLCNKKFLGGVRVPTELLYNAVDTDHFVPNPSRRDPNWVTLLVAGSHHWTYKLETTLRALKLLMQEIPNVRLWIAGTLRTGQGIWDVKDRVPQLIAELGIQERVLFSSTYMQQEAPLVYQKGDLLIHATWKDASPYTVIEAMACGLPVVYSTSGGTPELVGSDAGLGVPAEDSWTEIQVPSHEVIAENVLRILKNRDRFARAARQRAVKCFNIAGWVGRHEAVFNKLLSSRQLN